MEEIFQNSIDGLINSFDFTYCVIVNVLAYLIISTTIMIRKQDIGTWIKRLILIGASLIVGIIYYIFDYNTQIIINSFILAPVSWSWIMKPICNKLHIDYKDILKDKE